MSYRYTERAVRLALIVAGAGFVTGCGTAAMHLTTAPTQPPATSVAAAPPAPAVSSEPAPSGGSAAISQQLQAIESQLQSVDQHMSSANAGINSNEGDPGR